MRIVLLSFLVGLASLTAPVQPAAAQDMRPVVYAAQYHVDGARLDSLITLIETYQAPWHRFVAENVPGYSQEYYRHDTGNEYNLMIVTTYPDWDMVRGDEIPFSTLFPQYLASIGMTMEQVENDGVEAMFEWAWQGSTHMDQIWRPVAVDN